MFKRIIPCFLLLAIAFSSVVPVYAFADGDWGVSFSSFEDAMKAVSDDAALAWQYDENKTYGGCTVAADGNHILRASKGALIATGECTMCHQGLGQVLSYYYAHGGETGTYQDYVAQNYPLNGYGSDGGFYYCVGADNFDYFEYNGKLVYKESLAPGTIIRSNSLFECYFLGFLSSGIYVRCHCTDYNKSDNVYIMPYSWYSFNAPVSGTYVPVIYMLSDNCRYDCSFSSKFYSSDSLVRFAYSLEGETSTGVYSDINFIFPYPVFKVTPSKDITTNNYYVQSSRVGSVNFNLATKQGDVVNNYYPNVQLFNETTNVYTNPSTGQQQNVSSWTYDYSSRTYHLTLEDGSLLDIEFGDNSIQVKINGEITQEYYYTVENDEEPGPSPSPDPGPVDPTVTPTPDPGTPTPTPEAGPDPDDPDAPDGFFEWLKQWLIEFKEWLGDWLDKLFNKEPGDITIDESDNSVHINDQDDLDYDIYYTDDQGEERKTSLRDLLHKFDFLRDIYDIGRDLFSIVGADAAAAHAYNTSGSVDITPYLGDLRTIAAADVMPIAGGGAPSLKMDLGAANSHYGFKYGGEIEILDLSWYTPYKATVDNLLSGFLWLFFVWRLFKHAPNIVSGAGMVTDKAEDIRAGKRPRE